MLFVFVHDLRIWNSARQVHVINFFYQPEQKDWAIMYRLLNVFIYSLDNLVICALKSG